MHESMSTMEIDWHMASASTSAYSELCTYAWSSAQSAILETYHLTYFGLER